MQVSDYRTLRRELVLRWLQGLSGEPKAMGGLGALAVAASAAELRLCILNHTPPSDAAGAWLVGLCRNVPEARETLEAFADDDYDQTRMERQFSMPIPGLVPSSPGVVCFVTFTKQASTELAKKLREFADWIDHTKGKP